MNEKKKQLQQIVKKLRAQFGGKIYLGDEYLKLMEKKQNEF